MSKIIECVPNFSEGRNKDVIDQIINEIKNVDGVELLDCDPGKSTNRTVVTFVGAPEPVIEAAFLAIKKAQELIDMSKHTGAHSRMGATDVCPLVPVANVSIEECIDYSKKLAKKVGEELGIPVYLYENSASSPERRKLDYLRSGQYEALETKLPTLKPDFGPCKLNDSVKKSGATTIGCRKFLIAYNINLNTKDKKIAHDIALDMREMGRAKRDENNKIVRDKDGKMVRVPGMCKMVKGVGWYVEDYGLAQISVNLNDYQISGMHTVVDAAIKIAQKKYGDQGIRITGSELIGVVPLEAIVMAGKHYLKLQKKSTAVPVDDIIHTAIISLGLSDVKKFNPKEKIIELRLEKDDKSKIENHTIKEFSNNLSTDSPAPGGGSVAALCGNIASALVSMVCNLTIGKKGYEENWDKCNTIGEKAQKLKDYFLSKIDEDTEAFNGVIAARRIKKSQPDRDEKIIQANRKSILVPFSVIERIPEIFDLAKEAIKYGNKNALSDGGVSGLCAHSAGWGAYYNVLINIKGIGEDKEWGGQILKKADDLMKIIDEKAKEVKDLTLKLMN